MHAPEVTFDNNGNIASITTLRSTCTHAHARKGALLRATVPALIRHHKYVLMMPNNGYDNDEEGKGITATMRSAYRIYHEIMDVKAKHGITGFNFPLMTLYLTDLITPEVVEEIAASKFVYAIKSYPTHGKGVEGTTNSGHGIPFDEVSEDVIKAMIEHNVQLLIHAEDVHDKHGRLIDFEEREAHCIEHRLRPFREKYPDLRIHGEHASTIQMFELMEEDESGKTTLGVTPHHATLDNEALTKLNGNLARNMPYLKGPAHRDKAAEVITSGDPRVDAGSDTAPHLYKYKHPGLKLEEAACGCSLPHAHAMYAKVFIDKKALDRRYIEFTALRGPKRFGLPPPAEDDVITIRAETEHDIPDPTPVPEKNDTVAHLGWTEDPNHPDRMKIGYAI